MKIKIPEWLSQVQELDAKDESISALTKTLAEKISKEVLGESQESPAPVLSPPATNP